jgi:hypothetical protein
MSPRLHRQACTPVDPDRDLWQIYHRFGTVPGGMPFWRN